MRIKITTKKFLERQPPLPSSLLQRRRGNSKVRAWLLVSPILVCSLQSLQAAEKSSASTKADRSAGRAMSVLRVNCLSCHNEEKKKGGLRLTTRENALKGSDNGPVLVP